MTPSTTVGKWWSIDTSTDAMLVPGGVLVRSTHMRGNIVVTTTLVPCVEAEATIWLYQASLAFAERADEINRRKDAEHYSLVRLARESMA